ncbi:MAG: hypothetical protein RL318_658 [Fibrobacterota bacterium]|jgi:hypothetical protein
MKALEDLPGSWRALVALFTANLALGYTVALGYVWKTTSLRPDGIAARYRGNADDPTAIEIAFPKPLEEMLGTTHTHVLAMVVFLFLLGALTLLARRPGARVRTALALEPLIALPISFAGLWLAWGVHPGFTWLVSLSSGLAALAFYLQVAVVLRACLFPDRGPA